MRTIVNPLIAVLLLLRLASPTAGQEQARPVVEKAVKALGGLDKLTRGQGSIRKVKGKFSDESFFGTTYSQGPDLLKLVALPAPDSKVKYERILLVKGAKAWLQVDGHIALLDTKDATDLHRARHADRVAGLVCLLQDKGFHLTLVGESRVKDHDTLEVMVQYKEQPDIRLFFDKTSSLLIKSWQKFTDASGPKIHENYYSHYEMLDPVWIERDVLVSAQLPTDPKALQTWLAKRIPNAAQKAQVAALIGDLGSDSFVVRTKATESLKKLGPEVAPQLEEAVAAANGEVELRLRQCLAHFAEGTDVSHIAAAVRVMGAARIAGTAQVLLDYLPYAPSTVVRDDIQAALYDLAQSVPTDLQLIKALTDADPVRRKAAEAALGKDGGAYAKKPGRRLLVGGLKFARRNELYRNGTLEMEMDILDLQFFNALEEKLFVLSS